MPSMCLPRSFRDPMGLPRSHGVLCMFFLVLTSPSIGLGLEWTTSNAMSYICADTMDLTSKNLACAQSEYPAGTSPEGTDAVLTCPTDDGVIECFVFASVGRVGGSCSGDAFMEDTDGWAYLPAAAGQACVGQNSCTLVQTETAINGETLAFDAAGAPSVAKAKYIAVCSGTYINPEATSANTGGGDTGGSSCASACEGEDDQGNACPPDLNQDGLCPPGCTVCSGSTVTTAAAQPDTTPAPLKLEATATLEGMTLATFDELVFRDQVAAIFAGKDRNDVSVTDKQEVTLRRLLATGLKVDYEVDGFADAAAVSAAKSTMESKESELETNLKQEAAFSALTGITIEFSDSVSDTTTPSPTANRAGEKASVCWPLVCALLSAGWLRARQAQ